MRAFILLAVLAASGEAQVVHKEPLLPSGWEDSASPLERVSYRFSLKQDGLRELKQMALRVSDPDDSLYGKYLSQQEIDRITAPPAGAAKTVMDWVSTSNGCSASITREVVEVQCLSATAAEEMLSTKCREVKHSAYGQRAVRCSDFWLPSNVDDVVHVVYGLHGLPLPPRPTLEQQGVPANPQNVTPKLIETTYKVAGVEASRSQANRQAVAEFQGQTMSVKDLTTFFNAFLPDRKPEDYNVTYVGDPGKGLSQTEADLDIQYIMGVAPGILTEFWYFKGMDFCGDLKTWTGMILAEKNPPLVHSVSYGWQGNLSQLNCVQAAVDDVDANFAKLAARGITILFASGDSGSGYAPPHSTQCFVSSSFDKDTTLTGTVAHKYASPSATSCCEQAGSVAGKGWSFIPGKTDTCSAQTHLKDVAFDGFQTTTVKASSEDECCQAATAQGKSMWTFKPSANSCQLYMEVRGRHAAPGATSGIGQSAGQGSCSIFSEITGKQSTPGVTSQGQQSKPQIKLYPSWPASSPWVTSVGGTRFVGQKAGQPEMATDQFGSGGGFSEMFDAFDAQKDAVAQYFKVAPQLPPDGSFPRGGRATPDVAALGEGYSVVINGHMTAVGGTSASTPMFGGLVSLLNEARLAKKMPAMGYLNPWLYKHPDVFTDITLGDNAWGRGPFRTPYGFNCTKGWDPVTGLGTPQFDKMLAAATSPGHAVVV